MTDPTADDLLLRPTIQVPLAGHPPWRLSSQGYVALFGGLLAGTVVGVVSAGRLGAGTGRRVLMVVLCVVGLAVTVTLAIALNRALTASITMPVDVGGATTRVTVAQPSGTTTYIRVSVRLVAVLVYLVQARIQRVADRAYRLRSGAYAPLWGAGLAAVLVLGAAEILAVGWLTEVFS